MTVICRGTESNVPDEWSDQDPPDVLSSDHKTTSCKIKKDVSGKWVMILVLHQ